MVYRTAAINNRFTDAFKDHRRAHNARAYNFDGRDGARSGLINAAEGNDVTSVPKLKIPKVTELRDRANELCVSRAARE